MIFLIVWIVILAFVASAIPGYDQIFWIVTFFFPPLILWAILVH